MTAAAPKSGAGIQLHPEVGSELDEAWCPGLRLRQGHRSRACRPGPSIPARPAIGRKVKLLESCSPHAPGSGPPETRRALESFKSCPKVATGADIWPQFENHWPTLGRFGRMLVEIDHLSAGSAQIWPALAKFGRSATIWPDLTTFAKTSAMFGGSLARISAPWPNIG